jgi:hypothetical protein
VKRHEVIFESLKDHLCVIGAKYPAAEVGQVYEDVEDCFQALACCHLLRKADKRKFQNNLIWAALARRHFLLRCQREKNDADFRQARSRSDAIFCALAAGDRELAIEIGKRSPDTAVKEGEYPDDFAYHFLIYRLAASAPDEEVTAAREAYKASVDDGGERLEVCEALCARDASAFDDAFAQLVDHHTTQMNEERLAQPDRPTFEPKSLVFIEGLALLRLAEWRGIERRRREYPPQCPSIAIVKPAPSRPDDIFLEL